MNEDLERRLHDGLHAELPPAPAATQAVLERLPLDHPKVGRRSGFGRAAVMAVVGIGLVALASVAGLGGSPEPSGSTVAPPTAALPSPTGPPPPSRAPSDTPNTPLRPDRPLRQRAAWPSVGGSDRRRTGRAARVLVGSAASATRACPRLPPPGELQIRCHDGEFGITEREEPIGTLTEEGRATCLHDGPALTPYVEEALAQRLFTLPFVNGQFYDPVPIVVVGHFDDPRADDCQAEFRQLCRDRLVLDEIVEFHPEAVPDPGCHAIADAVPVRRSTTRPLHQGGLPW